MSFLDLILKQDLILISLGFVLLPLALAFGMVIFRAIRSLITGLRIAREKRQQEKQTRRSAKPQPVQHFTDDPERDVLEIEEEEDLIGQPLSEEIVEAVEEITADAETTVTNAMQDILNDVFVDDGSDERVEVLLGDASKIDVQDLAEFAQTIAQRLSIVHPAV